MDDKNQLKLDQILLQLENPDFSSEINEKDVALAKERIKNKIFSTQDLFIVLCSINLLNAAIKKDQFKKSLSYSEIKGNAARILTYLVSLKHDKFNSAFYINEEEKCAYLEIYNLQFSFHQIAINKAMEEFIKSERNKVAPWKGKRLQRIAGELLRFAIGLESHDSI